MSIYGKDFFQSQTLQEQAKAYLKVLPKNVTRLLSTGSSGCSIASAMLALSPRLLAHTYVRKPGEQAHSKKEAGDTPKYGENCAIVDDVISTGRTIERILKYAKFIRATVKVIIVYRDYREYDREPFGIIIKTLYRS